jgi:hypothetical protein
MINVKLMIIEILGLFLNPNHPYVNNHMNLL